MKQLKLLFLFALSGCLASAANFSFQGSFTADDSVQLFNFTVGTSSTVTLQTWSYAGGIDAQGAAIPSGGFDPILALFDSTGLQINQNDDGGGNVPADPTTGQHYDTYLQSTLAPGTYTVSVMEYDNFANGPNLSNGFERAGQGDFTAGLNGCTASAFCDVTGAGRTANWEFDVLNVNAASTPGGPTSGVPEPSSVLLIGCGGAALVALRRKLTSR